MRVCGLEVSGMENAKVGSGSRSMPLEESAESRVPSRGPQLGDIDAAGGPCVCLSFFYFPLLNV